MTKLLRSASSTNAHKDMDRRSLLRAFGAAFAAAPLAKLIGCAPAGMVGDAGADAAGADAALDAMTADAMTADAAASGWITGGTARITGTYADPFTAPGGTACSLICQTTIGPCHTTSPMREDVSNGLDGLPVLLSLRVLDERCQPAANTIVEIWHTNYKGIYSGMINTMCNSAAEDRAAEYFRGYVRTDANGVAKFKTCYPGWYRGRAVHIHVRVMSGDYMAADNATASVITQVLFTDELVRQVFNDVALYRTFGQPDTLLTTDNVVGAIADKTPYVLDISQASDGVMLASKTLIVRATGSSSTLCSAGAMGMMG